MEAPLSRADRREHQVEKAASEVRDRVGQRGRGSGRAGGHRRDEEGSVAAPTAALQFTPDLVARLQAAGISLHKVTLHVGAGTFLPVKAEDTAEHKMHAEWGEIEDATASALNAARAPTGGAGHQ